MVWKENSLGHVLGKQPTVLHKQDWAKTILPKIGAYIRTEQYEQNSTATQL